MPVKTNDDEEIHSIALTFVVAFQYQYFCLTLCWSSFPYWYYVANTILDRMQNEALFINK
jgi:hypothetical protein